MVEQDGYFHVVAGEPDRIRDRLQSGTAALMIPALQIYGFRHRFRLGTDILSQMYTGYSFRRNYPLGPELSRSLQALVESGVADFIRDRYGNIKKLAFPSPRRKQIPRCRYLWEKSRAERDHFRSIPEEKTEVRLSLYHLAALWAVFGIGLLAACAAAAAEGAAARVGRAIRFRWRRSVMRGSLRRNRNRQGSSGFYGRNIRTGSGFDAGSLGLSGMIALGPITGANVAAGSDGTAPSRFVFQHPSILQRKGSLNRRPRSDRDAAWRGRRLSLRLVRVLDDPAAPGGPRRHSALDVPGGGPRTG